jgi:hypothetical protein
MILSFEGGIVLEEAVDLSSDRLLMIMICLANIQIYRSLVNR